MPTYEYVCIDCGTHVEVFQHFSEDPLTTCLTCGGRLRKVFHPAGIMFKGSGFYKTDSRSAARSSAGSSHASGDSKGATDSKGSTDGAKTTSASQPKSSEAKGKSA